MSAAFVLFLLALAVGVLTVPFLFLLAPLLGPRLRIDWRSRLKRYSEWLLAAGFACCFLSVLQFLVGTALAPSEPTGTATIAMPNHGQWQYIRPWQYYGSPFFVWPWALLIILWSKLLERIWRRPADRAQDRKEKARSHGPEAEPQSKTARNR